MRAARAALIGGCLLALLACGQAALASTVTDGAATVGIEQCVTSTVQLERSATFTAQMTATAATQKMAMRLELQQRLRGESEFHTLTAPGFGVWRVSEPGVKIYKYVKQVTNLDSPAAYRVLVRFRWSGKGATCSSATNCTRLAASSRPCPGRSRRPRRPPALEVARMLRR